MDCLIGPLAGASSFVCNATCAAEGDNSIMELKVCQDIVRRRNPRLPLRLFAAVSCTQCGRQAVCHYISCFARAMMLGKAALEDGQLLKDIAWARAHMRIISAWLKDGTGPAEWLESYARVAVRFPTPVTM